MATRKGGKKVQDLDKFLKQVGDGKVPVSQKDLYALKYSKSLQEARADENEKRTINRLKTKVGKYSMRTRVLKNPWVKEGRPSNKALSWLYKTVFQNSQIYRYNRRLMYQGGMFTFEYFNPKYKDTSVLPWFDQFPLVISLGPIETNLGIRNIGFNLHLLPPKIRIIVMCSIFELHKRMYRFQIFMKRESPVQLDYRLIVHNLKRYGVGFSVRMYIPSRQRSIVRFPYRDWHKAIFIPSRGYYDIRAKQLIQEWHDYGRKHGEIVSPNLDWKTNI